jgi:DNA adenine methylase
MLVAFKFAGGKVRVSKWIAGFFPKHKYYVEPFGGSAAVLLNKSPSQREVYNDLDERLYNFFYVLRDEKLRQELFLKLEFSPYSRQDYTECIKYEGDDKVELARSFYVKIISNITNESTNIRESHFDVRGWKTRNCVVDRWHEKKQSLLKISDRLKHVIIENLPYDKIFNVYDDKDSFFYCDQPYLLTSQLNKRARYKYSLTKDDHVELSERVKRLRGGVILSSYQNELYDELYKGWRKFSRETLSMMGTKRVETVYLSPSIKNSPGLL